MKIQLFITCLAEQFYPSVPKKMAEILERLGHELLFPVAQTCCGQPLFNSGFQSETRQVVANWLQAFGKCDAPIVSPSSSCVEMVRHHFHTLFPDGTPEHVMACDLAQRTFEFSEFLVHQLKVTDLGAHFPHKVTYHPSCHGLRGLGLRAEAKQLLGKVRDLKLVPLSEEETCCGFGGVFSVIYPEVSRAMMNNKINNIIASGADVVVVGDAGCLMNIGGGLRQAGAPVKAMHLIEVLSANGAAK